MEQNGLEMWWAAYNGNKAKMDQLLDRGVDIEFKAASNVSKPLHARRPRAGRRLMFASRQLSGC